MEAGTKRVNSGTGNLPRPKVKAKAKGKAVIDPVKGAAACKTAYGKAMSDCTNLLHVLDNNATWSPYRGSVDHNELKQAMTDLAAAIDGNQFFSDYLTMDPAQMKKRYSDATVLSQHCSVFSQHMDPLINAANEGCNLNVRQHAARSEL